MARDVFSRYEKKYLLNETQRDILSRALAEKIPLDPFSRERGWYEVCSLYYDTADDALIRHSLEKPAFKEKLRLRTYGTPAPDAAAFLELKKKYRGRIYKRRTPIWLSEAGPFAENRITPEETGICNSQILEEITFFVHRYRLQPTIYIACERMAYGQDDLRITFDRNIVTRRSDLHLESGIYGERLLPEGTLVMEIKNGACMPLWLSHLLAELRLYTESFSKYGREYTRFISHAGRERYGCRETAVENTTIGA